jgi:hypothetical protein
MWGARPMSAQEVGSFRFRRNQSLPPVRCMVAGHGYAPEWRARAISLTVGMAVFAAGIGPEAVRHVRSSLDANYSGRCWVHTVLWIWAHLFPE